VSLRERVSQIDRATAGQLALFLIGVSLIIVAPAAEPPSGTFLSVEERQSEDTLSENVSVIEYQELSPDMQDAFQRAVESNEGRAQISEDINITQLTEYDYIHYQGEYYEFSFTAVDSVGLGQVLLVGGLGVLAIVVAGLWRLRGPRNYEMAD